jgi:hypothetical protein
MRVTQFTYVDDILVESVDDTPEKVLAKQQEASHMLCQWTRDNKQSILGEKSQWIMITRAHIYRDKYSLTFDGEPVPQVEVIVCLGVANANLLTILSTWTDSEKRGPRI